MTCKVRDKISLKSGELQKRYKRGFITCEEARLVYLGYLTCLFDLGYISSSEKTKCVEQFCLETIYEWYRSEWLWKQMLKY